jgi:hypothetical protein
MHAASTTALVTTAAFAAAGATSIDSLQPPLLLPFANILGILSLCCWLRHPISEVPHGLSRHYLAEPFRPKVLLTYEFSHL